jgi:hypothetical protein
VTFPTVRPARPAYPPRIPSGFIDPGGKTPVERALRTQQAVADHYTACRAAHSPNIDPDMLKDNAGAFQVSDAALALAPALDAVKADADAAKAKVNDLVKGQKVDASDVAAQLAAERLWRRRERTLNAIEDTPKLVSAARDLIANASDAEIPVLSEELGSYLASRNVPTGWMTDALAGRIPGLADAQADAILKSRQSAIVAHNHAGLANAMAKDLPAPRLLDPYSDAVNSKPYTNGEPYSPTNTE